ncbi:hypothetical protein [Streptomyces caniscabiei]|uniref:hypothetical protein n=1 Tax=Streptomyces caniscabiei TaxID=2746961 RepID=UPI0029AEA2BD|nr:hypothetical protein [Streptomyces caniscabiei]MDX2943309.1 hypothetical protein [Streptomyces caniscabiei]
MDEFTAAEAAKWLDISREAVDLAAREGRLSVLAGEGPRRFSRAAVDAYHQGRVLENVAALARAGETPVSAARKVRQRLHAEELGMPRPFAVRLKAMPITWRSVFSPAELAAACVRDGEGCRWCRAREFADFRGLRPPEFSPALRELFGADPCGVCGPGLLKPFMVALRARIHNGAGRPSAPAPPPSEAERAAAREWALRRPVTASAQPSVDDDGKALVARRLKETRTRLKDAKRRGDQRHAIRLQQTLQSLTADASAIDARASKRGQR